MRLIKYVHACVRWESDVGLRVFRPAAVAPKLEPIASAVTTEDTTVDTLLAPISGPWLKSGEAVDFIRAVAPRPALAIHEMLFNETALGLVDGLLKALSRADVPPARSG